MKDTLISPRKDYPSAGSTSFSHRSTTFNSTESHPSDPFVLKHETFRLDASSLWFVALLYRLAKQDEGLESRSESISSFSGGKAKSMDETSADNLMEMSTNETLCLETAASEDCSIASKSVAPRKDAGKRWVSARSRAGNMLSFLRRLEKKSGSVLSRYSSEVEGSRGLRDFRSPGAAASPSYVTPADIYSLYAETAKSKDSPALSGAAMGGSVRWPSSTASTVLAEGMASNLPSEESEDVHYGWSVVESGRCELGMPEYSSRGDAVVSDTVLGAPREEESYHRVESSGMSGNVRGWPPSSATTVLEAQGSNGYGKAALGLGVTSSGASNRGERSSTLNGAPASLEESTKGIWKPPVAIRSGLSTRWPPEAVEGNREASTPSYRMHLCNTGNGNRNYLPFNSRASGEALFDAERTPLMPLEYGKRTRPDQTPPHAVYEDRDALGKKWTPRGTNYAMTQPQAYPAQPEASAVVSTSYSNTKEYEKPFVHSSNGLLNTTPMHPEVQELMVKDLSHHLILKWTNPHAHYVEVAGTFSSPPWVKRFPLKWCPRLFCHWIDVHATVDGAVTAFGGHHQFKFIVDGKWMCNPSLPICDDGSHNLNNVVVIFPEGIMRRTSQRHRRQTGKQNASFPSLNTQLNVGPSTSSTTSKHAFHTTAISSQSTPSLVGIWGDPHAARSTTKTNFIENNKSGLFTPSPMNNGLKRSAGTGNLSVTVESSPPPSVNGVSSSPVAAGTWVASGRSPPTENESGHTYLASPRGFSPSTYPTSAQRDKELAGTSGTTLMQWEKYNKEYFVGNGVLVSGEAARTGRSNYGQSPIRHENAKSTHVSFLTTEASSATAPFLVHSNNNVHLNRCNSAYESGLVAALEEDKLRRVQSMSPGYWPASVLELLHQPETLLKLNVPVDAKERNGLTLQCGACMIPHPDKVDSNGADAYFMAHSDTNKVCVGVADGVGEWDSIGLNPRMFAEELMQGCMQHFKRHSGEAFPVEQFAEEILSEGYEYTKSYGSSTALIVCLDDTGERVGVANLGDSAMVLLRRQRVYEMTCVYRTKEQQHQFNCPYQLSRLPKPEDYERLASEGNELLVRVLKNSTILPQDTPSMAEFSTHEVTEGDLIILGTDGVFDNLYDYELCALANLALSPYEGLLLHNSELVTPAATLAAAIAEAASFRSKDATAKTPFMKHAREAGTNYIGGKLDDITVVACWVTRGGQPMC